MILRRHAGAVEADFQRFYSIDLLDLWRGRLSPRKAAQLLRWLPPGAATWRAMGVDAAWSSETHHLASVIDVLQGANWQRGGGKGSAPKPIPRPEQIAAAEARAVRDEARARAFLARQSKERGGT